MLNVNNYSKRRKSIITLNILWLYLCFTAFLVVEEPASLAECFENSMLDSKCFIFLLDVIKLNMLMFWNGINLGAYIIIHHKKLFCPWFDNFELSAFWIFSLVLILSSDVHPNPGPSSNDRNFSSGFLSFCNWNLNTLSKENFYRISLLEAHNTIF